MSAAKTLAIVGPTASGKSDLAMELARKSGASILSCDSLLVYRDMNIGTAKPTDAERKEVQHFGIDLVDFDQPFTAGDYVRYAKPIVDEHIRDGKPLIIVGGTGFYLKALLCGIWDAPPTDPEIRRKLDQIPAPELYAELERQDPEYAKKVSANDKYRVVRALEILELTGEKVSDRSKSRDMTNAVQTPCEIVGVKRPKLELELRIVERTNSMFERGLLKETKDLLERAKGEAPRAMHCVGYVEVLNHLKGEMNLADTRERVCISTRQLAKKQHTFFKTFPVPIEWFLFPSQAQEAEAFALRRLT